MSNLTNCHAIVILTRIKVQQTNWSNKMKNPAKKLTLSITAGLLLSSLLLPSAFAADLPAGAVVSGGLTWTRNNSTVEGKFANWRTASNTCASLNGWGSGKWRLPTRQELITLHTASEMALIRAGWTLDNTWSSETSAGSSDTDHHSGVRLNDGSISWTLNSGLIFVSCVRVN